MTQAEVRRGLIEEDIKSRVTYDVIGARWHITRQRVQQIAARIGHKRNGLSRGKKEVKSRDKPGRPPLAPLRVQCVLCLQWFLLEGRRLVQYRYWKKRSRGMVRSWCPMCVKRRRGG